MATDQLTKGAARRALLLAREDIARMLSRHFEDVEGLYRALAINSELYEGITGEEAPEVAVRSFVERAS